MNSSNKYPVSPGPGLASGWNWTPKIGLLEWVTPSTVPSLAFLNELEKQVPSRLAPFMA